MTASKLSGKVLVISQMEGNTMENHMVGFILEPSLTDSEMFYVYIMSKGERELVAGVERIDGHQWRALNGEATYDSLAMAIMADANLSDPQYWTE